MSNEELESWIKAVLKYLEKDWRDVHVIKDIFNAQFGIRCQRIGTLTEVVIGPSNFSDVPIIITWERDNMFNFRLLMGEEGRQFRTQKYQEFRDEVKRIQDEYKTEWQATHEGKPVTFVKVFSDLGAVYLQALLNGEVTTITYGSKPGTVLIGGREVKETTLTAILNKGIETLKAALKHKEIVSNPLLMENLINERRGKIFRKGLSYTLSEELTEVKIDIQVLVSDELLNQLYPSRKVLEQIEKT